MCVETETAVMLDISCMLHSIGVVAKMSVWFRRSFFEVASILELKPVRDWRFILRRMLSSHNTTRMHVTVSLLMEHLTLLSALKAASMQYSIVV